MRRREGPWHRKSGEALVFLECLCLMLRPVRHVCTRDVQQPVREEEEACLTQRIPGADSLPVMFETHRGVL